MFAEDDAEIDRILAQAEGIDQGASQEILGAVWTPTTQANVRQEGVAPGEGGNSQLRNGGDSRQWSLPFLALTTVSSVIVLGNERKLVNDNDESAPIIQ